MSAHSANRDLFDADCTIPDPGSAGTIYVDKSLAVVELVSAGAESRTLDRPTKRGTIVTLFGYTVAGTITVTVTGGYNQDGDTTFSITTADQFVTFQSVYTGSAYVWRKLADYGLSNIAPADSAVLDELSGLTATATEINARAAAASRIVNVTDAATYAVLAADSGKIHIMPNFTASCTLTLPTAAAGLEYEFISKAVAADAQDWIIKSPSATNFFLGGVSFADTDAGAGADEIHAGVWSNGSTNDFLTVVTPGAGTRIHVICDGTNWIVNGQVFSATVPAFSDT